ncbi:hypothetical protein NDU88_002317 [Pleurodeles waltl]|uniref:Uncharacterized protein n=1 Tax=Pleurodeles waltl TaxID=8319 RepID=A0AAV7VDG7_PLEWA|nr:hypothetical protein NDU88_002317 [Pleurodeles waltl]
MPSKARQKQPLEGKPLTSRHPTRNQDAMEPELQVLPMLVYLPIYQEDQRRQLRRRWRNRVVLGFTRWYNGSPDGCPFDVPGLAGAPMDEDLVAEVLVMARDNLALGEGRGEEDGPDVDLVAAVEPVDSEEEEAEEEDIDNRNNIIRQYFQ